MKKVSLKLRVVLGGLLMLPMMVWSQCPNLDFSTGTLANWQCYMGSCSNQNYWIMPTLPIPGRVDIMDAALLQQQGQFYDEYCPTIPKVPDGYAFSCRIGNSRAGAEVDGIEYEMVVDSTNSLLIISYAWVMQNSGLEPPYQPRFAITMKDSLGRVLPIPCNPIAFISGFLYIPLACDNSTQASTWTTMGYDLSNIIGQKIKIYFETLDSPLGNHFGYAYVVAECRPMRIDLQYCDGTKTARMIAPDGFSAFEWTRSSVPSWRAYTKQINIQEPLDGEIFTCTLASALGPACSSQLQTVIVKTKVDANFMFGVRGDFGTLPEDVCFACNNYRDWYDTCSRTATFVDFSRVHNSKKSRITWQIPDLAGFIPNHDSVFTYTFPDVDTVTTYLVRLLVEAENGCADTSYPTNHYITIYPSAKVKIKPVCYDNSLFLKAVPLRHTFYEHRWSWIDAGGMPQTATDDSIQIFSSGTYWLQSLSDDWCFSRDSFQVTSFDGNSKLYTIEGKVTHNGNPLSKLPVYVDDPSLTTDYTLTDDLGEYCIIADSNATLNLTPSLSGYEFNPPFISCSNIANNLYNQDFTATIPVTGIYLPSKYITIDLEPYYRPCSSEIKSSVIPYNADNKNITYLSTNPAVIWIDNSGLSPQFITQSIGTSTIIITTEDGGFSDSCIVTVVPVHVTQVIMDTKELTLAEEQIAQLLFIIVPWSATNKSVIWTSRNDSIATVNSNGLVTAVAIGTTYIVVTTNDGNFQDSCQVTVSNVGVKQLQGASYKLQVYPNPTNGKLQVTSYELQENSVVEIYDVVGQLLYQINKSTNNQINNEVSIDISHLSAGMYFLKVDNKVVKFVKE